MVDPHQAEGNVALLEDNAVMIVHQVKQKLFAYNIFHRYSQEPCPVIFGISVNISYME